MRPGRWLGLGEGAKHGGQSQGGVAEGSVHPKVEKQECTSKWEGR
jgi:hypothetical protein